MPVYFESRKNKRRTNQDYHLFFEYRVNHEAKIRTMLVADGMGGLACGELASSLAGEKWILKLQKLTISKEFLGKSLNEQMEQLKSFSYSVVQEINEEIYQELSNRGVKGGTTLTTAIFYWDTLIFANCGDSPAYFYGKKDSVFLKISREQNAAEELLREGKVKKDSPDYWKHKNMLTDYLGKYRKAEPFVTSMPFRPGDRILMGSDGAFGRLEQDRIKRIVINNLDTSENVVKEILAASEQQGEEDNQTLLFYVEEEEGVKTPGNERRGFFRKRQAVNLCTRS